MSCFRSGGVVSTAHPGNSGLVLDQAFEATVANTRSMAKSEVNP